MSLRYRVRIRGRYALSIWLNKPVPISLSFSGLSRFADNTGENIASKRGSPRLCTWWSTGRLRSDELKGWA